jgi:hypothetical protein
MLIEELFDKYNDIKQVYVIDINYDEREKFWLYLVNKDLGAVNAFGTIIGLATDNVHALIPGIKQKHRIPDTIGEDNDSFFKNEILYVEREDKKQLAFIIESSIHTLEVHEIKDNTFKTKEYNVITNGYYEY